MNKHKEMKFERVAFKDEKNAITITFEKKVLSFIRNEAKATGNSINFVVNDICKQYKKHMENNSFNKETSNDKD